MAESRSDPNQTNCLPSDNGCPQITQTQTVEKEEGSESPPVLTLRLHQPDRPDHRVKWSSDTVDNEFMGKKKSKCCCIYEKPKVFGESDTSSEEEDNGDEGCTPNCRGHKKKCYRHHKKGHHHDDDGGHHHHHDHHRDHDDDNMAGPSNACYRYDEQTSRSQNGQSSS